MLIPAIVNFFHYKVVASVIIFAGFSELDQIKIAKQFSNHGMSVAFSNDPFILERGFDYRLQGILYIKREYNKVVLEKINSKYFSKYYKWLIVGDEISDELNHLRYDSDMAMMKEYDLFENFTDNCGSNATMDSDGITVSFLDIYVHPRDGASMHIWAHWNLSHGITVTHDWDRLLRRKNLNKHPFKIAAPVAHYSEDTYNGTFEEYLVDNDMTLPDSGLRCGYGASSLLIEMLNATEELNQVLLWTSDAHNSSMIVRLETGTADLSAGVLRLLDDRISRMDYVLPIWLFHVGFTYLAERESSSNMYVEPFTTGVWCSCLIIGIILALAQRATSRKPEEKEGAFIAVLATWLQQDASAVPAGLSGRWTFMILSICSMLVHAYYTSAIVSALMSTGRGGPQSLRALADSRYGIASEDHDFIRVTMFDVKTTWDELEYLKKKKLTSKFYQDIREGVRLVQQGHTAYHAEYHQLIPHLNILSDDEICKMQHIDTVPEVMTWVTASPRGQYTDLFRAGGAWIQETGLAQKLIHRTPIHPPPCRAALLAERVTFWDVVPLLVLTAVAAIFSLCLLFMEIFVAKWRRQHKKFFNNSTTEYTL